MALRAALALIAFLLISGLFFSGFTESRAKAAVAQPSAISTSCDPFINAIASLIFPGWGQYLNNEPVRKVLIHISLGLGLTLAIIYFWKKLPEGNFARLGRLFWSIYSGLDAYNVCYSRTAPN